MDLEPIVSVLAAVLAAGAGSLSLGALAAMRSAWQRRFKQDEDASELSVAVEHQRKRDTFTPRLPTEAYRKDGPFPPKVSEDDIGALLESAASRADATKDAFWTGPEAELSSQGNDDALPEQSSGDSSTQIDNGTVSHDTTLLEFTAAARSRINSEANDLIRGYEIEAARFAYGAGASVVDVQHVAASKEQVVQMQLRQVNSGKGRTPEQRAFLVAAGALCSGFAAGTTPSLFADFSIGWLIAVVVAGIAGITLLVLGNPWWPRQKSAH